MKKIILTSVIALIGLLGLSQEIAQPHKAIVKAANERFELKNYSEAKKNFSQLISYYPSNVEFNFKFGVCNVMLGGDPNASVVHLSYAQSAGYEKDVEYYLGRAFHRNYDFNKAIKSFQKYKIKASKSDVVERDVDRYIDMCRNGKGLLNSIKDVVVLDKKQGTPDNFFRFYDLQNLGGKILAIPEELKTKQDKKRDFNGVFYFNGNSDVIYYASYGKSGETGKDIYEAHLLPNGKFGRVAKLGGDINSNYDEDYAFLHADGRTMYFSSKGHNSMGGYDVFKSEYDEGTSTFRNVINMDFAVNTPDDDIFYITDSSHNNAWFSSNRNVGEKEMNVYNVKVKGIPINLIFIKGNFIADFDESMKNAQIVMKDELTGKVISKVKTNSITGEYILFLTKPGLYKIEVNADNRPLTHQGYVQIPIFDEAVALGQELRLINESGQEKLIINNSFDLPLDVDMSELSKEFLRRKSGLEITPENEIIADVVEDIHIAQTTENAVLSAGFSEGTTVSQIVENSREDIAIINHEIEEIKKNNKAAFAYALAKQTEADSKLKESQDRFKESEKLEGNEYRTKILESNRLLIEADDLSTDAKAAYRIAKRSEKIAYDKALIIDELEKQIELIEKSNEEDDFQILASALRNEKNRINKKKGDLELSPGEIVNKEARQLEDLQEILLAEVKETSDRRTRINSKIDIKKAQLAKLTNKKEIESTNANIDALENQLAIVNKNLVKTLNEVKSNGTEEVILKKEAEFFENQYISPEEIYLADVNSISAEQVNLKLDKTNQSINERKITFGSNPEIVNVIGEEYPEALSWGDNNDLAAVPSETKQKKSETHEENLENYQVMIAIEKEVVKIENEKIAYLEDEKHSRDDAQFKKLIEKGNNLELQHNDIYAQQINNIILTEKEIDKVILNVDPKYNATIQEKLNATNEVEGFFNVREYRKELKDQLIYMANNNKQAILQESNARNLKKLINNDVEFQSAIKNLDNQINDVNLFIIAYDTENKEIIDSNQASAETLPKQIELTEIYIETLEKVSQSIDSEMYSGVDRSRKEALREIKYELSNEIINVKSKLDSYNSDLELTISTEGEFSDSEPIESVNIDEKYIELPTTEQGVISCLRSEYSEIFSSEAYANMSTNDKIILAIDKKCNEQKARLNANPNAEEKAILKMDMLSLVDIKEKVVEGEYVFVNYQSRKSSTIVKDDKDSLDDNVSASSDNTTEIADDEGYSNSIDDKAVNTEGIERGETEIGNNNTVQDDKSSINTIDEVVIDDNINNTVQDDKSSINTTDEFVIDESTPQKIDNNINVQGEAVTELVDVNPNSSENNYSDKNLISNENIDNQVAEVMDAENAAIKQMEDISFAFAPEKETLAMEVYGSELFDDAEISYKGTEYEFLNLNKIRNIQSDIVGLENAVFDGEVKNNERKLNKRFEKLYSELAYEEIKLANRLEAYTTTIIENQVNEIKQLEVLNKDKILDQDLTKSKIKVLKKEIENLQKKAESKRFQITKSNDELERNFFAREAFSMESDIIRNQQKIIYLYNNVDKIAQLDESTIEEMKSGTYIYEKISNDNIENTVTAQVVNDLDFVKNGQKLEYAEAYVNYVGHLEALKIKMDKQEEQKMQQNEFLDQIRLEESAIYELENELSHALGKKQRRPLMEEIAIKQTHLDKLVLDKNNLNEKILASSKEIKADLIKAEFLYSNAQSKSQIVETINDTRNEDVISNIESVEITNNSVDKSIEISEDVVLSDQIDSADDTIVSENTMAENVNTDITPSVTGNSDSEVGTKVSEETIVENVNADIIPSVTGNSDSEVDTKVSEETIAEKVVNNMPNSVTTPKTDLQILSNYKRTGEIEMNSEIPSGVIYRIQIGAFSTPVDSDQFTEFTPLSGESSDNGIVRYFVGWFNSYDDAKYVLEGVKNEGYADAFVVAYVDKKKTSIGEAIQKSKETVISNDVNTSSSYNQQTLLDYYYSYPNAVKAELITPSSGLFYTVQIGVFSKPLTAEELGEDKDLNIDILPNRNIRYSTGRFQDLEVAKTRNSSMHQKGYDDSFVTAYYNGKRISIAKAKELFGGIESDENSASNNNEDSLEDDKSESASSSIQNYGKESPVVVNTVVTQTTEHGEGIKIIEMEYDVLIGKFGDEIPFNLRKAINNLKATVEVEEVKEGTETIFFTARVKTIQEARNIQKDFENAGFEGTEVRAFRVE